MGAIRRWRHWHRGRRWRRRWRCEKVVVEGTFGFVHGVVAGAVGRDHRTHVVVAVDVVAGGGVTVVDGVGVVAAVAA
jgi:hypothetical protein